MSSCQPLLLLTPHEILRPRASHYAQNDKPRTTFRMTTARSVQEEKLGAQPDKLGVVRSGKPAFAAATPEAHQNRTSKTPSINSELTPVRG